MNEKQQQLLYDKGITNVPSDILCSDNTLEESIGMIYDDGEHRVIQKPVTQFTVAGTSRTSKILYIHKFNNEKRYIFLNYIPRGGYTLDWGKNNSGSLSDSGEFTDVDVSTEEKRNAVKVTSVGKTLVVTDSNGMHYYLWQDSSYKSLPFIPAPKCKFWMSTDEGVDYLKAQTTGDFTGIFKDLQQGDTPELAGNQQETYNNFVVGLYNKNKKTIEQQKGFCEPFLVRVALELYDGSYIHISQPIVMFPSITENSFGAVEFSIPVAGVNTVKGFSIQTFYSQLFCSLETDYDGFDDIVKDVVVFVSDGVNLYETDGDQPLEHINNGSPVYKGIVGKPSYVKTVNAQTTGILDKNCKVLLNRNSNDIKNDIESVSVFYKLCSLGIHKIDRPINTASRTPDYVMKNLTTQPTLEYDDYFSHCQLYPEFTYSYNSRLNVANVKRDFFEGFDFFLPWDNALNVETNYTFYVTIKTDQGNIVVSHTGKTTQIQGIYFFYPDSRATRVVIMHEGTRICDQELKEHPGLNGAYYFRGLPTIDVNSEPNDGNRGGSTNVTDSPRETLPNYLITSEVDNPFVFKAEGYYKVGTGKIIAMSSITQALSEGQFGQYPLLVFSTEGIWALSVASTGYYSSIHPMSREVCLEDNPCITQTDGAVFFASKKGLMVLAGNVVKCVSEQLNGKESSFSGEVSMGNFHDYLKSAYIAYDYRDSLLWIFKNNIEYCYIYSIKSGTFGKFYIDTIVDNVVNDYPDYLLSVRTTYWSLLDRPNINDDTGSYSGLMITRPMKLENGLAMKTIMDLKNLRQMQGTLKMRIFASNNLDNWFEVTSLGGVPWKYYRFRFDLSGMKATDRFAGTVLITQERRTDKLR